MNTENQLDELFTFLRFRSVSADVKFHQELIECANWLKNKLQNLRFNVSLGDEYGLPIVFAEYIINDSKPTILFYGHYDVQPAKKEDGWSTEPFEPTVIDNKIYARGSADNKSQIFAFIKAIEQIFTQQGKLPINIKIILEGEEESTGESVVKFVENYANELQVKAIVVADAGGFGYPKPSIVYATRGIVYKELTILGANKDLHSGSFGGIVPNPANIIVNVLGKICEPGGKINIPGVYEDVIEPDETEREDLKNLPFDDKKLCEEIGVKKLIVENDLPPLEQLWCRPNLAINGIISGYTEKGAKTIIPSKATAKFSIRLVPKQKAERISSLIDSYVESITPEFIRYEIKTLGLAEPFYIERNSSLINLAEKLLEKHFTVRPAVIREGGTIPILMHFKKHITDNILLLGLTRPDSAPHGQNEYFHIEDLEKSITFFIELIENFTLL